MVRQINPRFIICYGKLDEEFKANKIVRTYPTYWRSLTKARKEGKAKEFYEGSVEQYMEEE